MYIHNKLIIKINYFKIILETQFKKNRKCEMKISNLLLNIMDMWRTKNTQKENQ